MGQLLMRNPFQLRQYPLRVRLTAWYSMLLALILLLFSGFLYIQLKLNLLYQLDGTLKLTASYADNHLNREYDPPIFIPSESKNLSRYLQQGDFAVRLVTPTGNAWFGLGNYHSIPQWVPQNTGSKNLTTQTIDWRIYSQPLQDQNQYSIGWLQVAHSLTEIQAAETRFIRQVLVSLPIVLLIAARGGSFLLNQALRPIDRVTRTAQSIGASDLSQRIAYQGPTDEVGQLATTFDQMLDRIQVAFDRERRFTADVSHELRTPLTAMKGQLNVTLSRDRTQSNYQHTLMGIERNVDRLTRLTNDLLFLARADLGQWHSNLEPLNLSYLLAAVIEQAEGLAIEKGLTLHSQILPDLSLQGDPDQLIRVFLNLVDNAIKYTSAGGKVTLETHLVQTNPIQPVLHIKVKDTGIGIAPEHLPYLFERFYRVDKARDRRSGGAGLGLAIAAEIIRMHGGTLNVTSVVGQGTCVAVTIPTQVVTTSTQFVPKNHKSFLNQSSEIS